MTPKLSPAKTVLFSVLAITLFFGGIELLLAALGIEPVLYDDDPYVGFSSTISHFVEQRSSSGEVVMETAANKLRLFHRQQFLKHKAPGTFRIFCLGGSTTYGRPYGDSTSFCGWLREFLPAADPSRQWEVVNAGGISYASYRVALLAEELLAYEPDLFIVYTGHNEFLESRTYGSLRATPRAVRGAAALAARTRLFTFAKQTFERRRRHAPSPRLATPASTASKAMLEPEVRTLLDNSVGPDDYHRDDQLQQKVVDHYRFSLARIVDISRSVGAETLLIVPASNLRDCTPFKSQHSGDLDDSGAQRIEQLKATARAAEEAGESDRALAAIEEAVTLDGRFAELHLLHGKILVSLDRHTEARRAFERARDEDVCPLRALGEMGTIVEHVASGRQAPLVDFSALVDDRSEDGIPGRGLFLDHVHPTVDGNRLLALAILDELIEHQLVEPSSSWGESAKNAVRARVESNIDVTAQGRALSNLSRVLGWAGKLDEARELAIEATALAPELAVVQHQAALCAHLTGHLDEAETHYRQTLLIEPGNATAHSNLAVILDEDGRDGEAAIHYRRAIAQLDDRNAAYRDRLREALAKIEE